MCGKCVNIVNLEKNTNTKTLLFDESAKSIDVNYFFGFMGASNDENGDKEAYIKQEVSIKSTNRCYGICIPIKYCPFCGEKLYE